MISKTTNSRYNSLKRSSENYYKSDKIDKFIDRFTSNLRERNIKQMDIRSLAKSNLQIGANYEKIFLKKLDKKRKLEYI